MPYSERDVVPSPPFRTDNIKHPTEVIRESIDTHREDMLWETQRWNKAAAALHCAGIPFSGLDSSEKLWSLVFKHKLHKNVHMIA
jgi:hypothetical protein